MPASDPLPAARLRVLGTTELTGRDGRPADAILAQPKRLALLAYLCIARPAGFRRREQLLALFWPELDERRARSALSQALHRLRQALGPDVLLARGPDEVGVDPAVLACDVAELDAALAEGRIADALTLHRGELLPGLAISDSAEFDQWLDGERAALRERMAAAVRDATARAEGEGRLGEAVELSRRMLELAPYDEVALRRAMELFARVGDHAGAVRCYEEFAERLRRELELAPSPETAALVSRLRLPRAVAPRAEATVLPRTAVPAPMQAAPPIPATVAVPAPPPRRRARRTWVVAACVALALAVLVWRQVRGPLPSGAPAAHRVLVLPFTVRGDSTLAFLGDGMVELLSASIEGLADVHAVDPHAVLATAGPAGRMAPEEASAMARRLGADALVIGEVIVIADRLEVRGVLYDASGTRQAVLSAGVTKLALLPEAVDDLARQIVASRLSGPAQRLARLATLTTDSQEALRAYLEGEQQLREGRFATAVDAFRGAVRADSLFALAWFRMGVALEWLRASGAERRAALDRAVAMSVRLTERDRMLVLAHHAYAYGSLQAAETLYRQLVTAYPEDVEAWYGLAEVLFHGGPQQGRPLEQAEPAFRRLLTLHPEHLEGRLHLMRVIARRESPDMRAELDSLVRVTLASMESEPVQRLRLRALRAFVHDDAQEMAAVVSDAAGLPELAIWELGASIATMTGNLEGAARIIRLLTPAGRPAHWRAISQMGLANLAAAEGRWATARRELDAVAALDPTLGLFARASLSTAPWLPLGVAERDSVRRALEAWQPGKPSAVLAEVFPMFADIGPSLRLHHLVALSALVGDEAWASRHAEALAALGPLASPYPAAWELGADARALVAFGQGRAGEVLTALEGTRANAQLIAYPRTFIVTHALERWLRAESLRASGRQREALDWYGSFTCYLCVMDVPYEAPAWLRQAAIQEELGERQGARAAYAMVLERWRDADRSFAPMLEEARAGLARVAPAP